MEWEGRGESDNVEDRRDPPGDGGGPGGFGIGPRHIGIGIGTIAVAVAVALAGGWVLGVNPLTILGLRRGGAPVQHGATYAASAPRATAPHSPEAARQVAFVRTVLA